ncbi:acyl carrier protein [Nocardia tengchongensis]|uniref:acyl carrier protein n=1 Tax=Nocardia tengchongensis TaxID=2055889 RepID=UPI0036939378
MIAESVAAETVTRHLGAVLGIDPAAIDPGAALVALPGAESLRLMESLVRIEDELGVELIAQDEQLLMVRTVGDLVGLVVRTGAPA